MSEEEKKAIEELKSRREYFEFQPEGCNWHLSFDQWETHTIIDVVINYIEKLQKENELLKAPFEYAKRNTLDKRYVELNFISKDKIRNKIKELEENVKDFEDYWSKDPRKFKKEKSIDYYKLEALKELLGDDNNE